MEAVERAEKSLRTVTCYHPSCREGRRHKDWFKTRIPGQTQQRPQLIQSADDLHRSTSDSSYNVRLDPIFIQIGGPKAHVTLSMTDILFQQPHRREKRDETNPMKLNDLISNEYEEKVRNKPNVVILNQINILLGFPAPF